MYILVYWKHGGGTGRKGGYSGIRKYFLKGVAFCSLNFEEWVAFVLA